MSKRDKSSHADSSNSRETVLSDVLIDIEVVDVLNTLFEHLVSLKGELDIDVDVRGHPSDFEDCEHVYLLSDDMNTDQASKCDYTISETTKEDS